MFLGRHRQHLDVAVGELDEAIGLVGEPEVLLLAPRALRGQQGEDNVVKFLL